MTLAVLVLLVTAGDPSRGRQLYEARCGACHSLDDNGAGPRHRGVVGRKAATQPGFEYSQALRDSKLTWTRAKLERWLADPNVLVPGNKMMVQLANEPRDRDDLIAFLETAK